MLRKRSGSLVSIDSTRPSNFYEAISALEDQLKMLAVTLRRPTCPMLHHNEHIASCVNISTVNIVQIS